MRRRPAQVWADHDGRVFLLPDEASSAFPANFEGVCMWTGHMLAMGVPYGLTPAAKAALTNPDFNAIAADSAAIVLEYASPE